MTCWTCWPQPAQDFFWQTLQVTCWHIVSLPSHRQFDSKNDGLPRYRYTYVIFQGTPPH